MTSRERCIFKSVAFGIAVGFVLGLIWGCSGSPESPAGGDGVAVLLTRTEVRALVTCTLYGPASSYFDEDPKLRAALDSAYRKMVGLQ